MVISIPFTNSLQSDEKFNKFGLITEINVNLVFQKVVNFFEIFVLGRTSYKKYSDGKGKIFFTKEYLTTKGKDTYSMYKRPLL